MTELEHLGETDKNSGTRGIEMAAWRVAEAATDLRRTLRPNPVALYSGQKLEKGLIAALGAKSPDHLIEEIGLRTKRALSAEGAATGIPGSGTRLGPKTIDARPLTPEEIRRQNEPFSPPKKELDTPEQEAGSTATVAKLPSKIEDRAGVFYAFAIARGGIDALTANSFESETKKRKKGRDKNVQRRQTKKVEKGRPPVDDKRSNCDLIRRRN